MIWSSLQGKQGRLEIKGQLESEKTGDASETAESWAERPASIRDPKNLQCRCCRRRNFSPWVGKIPLEEGMATHPSTLAWRIQWTEESSGYSPLGLQRVKHDWSNFACMQEPMSQFLSSWSKIKLALYIYVCVCVCAYFFFFFWFANIWFTKDRFVSRKVNI